MALSSAAASDASALQRAGSVAAIVGASVAVLLLSASIVRWWWRHHRVWSVKPRVFISGEDHVYLGIKGLPASTAQVTAFVSDGTTTRKFGPAPYRRDIVEEHLFNLRRGRPLLDQSVRKYRVELIAGLDGGGSRRVFKKKVATPWRRP